MADRATPGGGDHARARRHRPPDDRDADAEHGAGVPLATGRSTMVMRRIQILAWALLALSAGAAAQWAPGAAVKVGKAPNFIRLTPDGKQAVVANYGSNDLSVLRVDAAKPEDRRVPAGFGPLGMAFSADGNGLYVANKDSGLIKEFKLPGFEMVDSYKVG